MKDLLQDRLQGVVELKKGLEPGEPMRPIIEAYRGDRIVGVAFVVQRENLEPCIDLMRGFMPTRLVIAMDVNFTSAEDDAEDIRDEKGNLDPSKDTVEEGIVMLGVAQNDHLGVVAPYWTDEFGNYWFMDEFDMGEDTTGPMIGLARDSVVNEAAPLPSDVVERDCETSMGLMRGGAAVLLFSEEGREDEAERLLEQLRQRAEEERS